MKKLNAKWQIPSAARYGHCMSESTSFRPSGWSLGVRSPIVKIQSFERKWLMRHPVAVVWSILPRLIPKFYYAIDSNKWSEIRIEHLSRIVYLVLFKCSITTLTFILKIQRWVIISTLELNYYSSKAQLGSWYCMVYRQSSYCSPKLDFELFSRKKDLKTTDLIDNKSDH